MITFVSEDIDFHLDNKINVQFIIEKIIKDEKKELLQLQYIFCSDNYLLKINQEYLKHNYFTDIITFDLSDEEHKIESDIFISIDRVKENSIKFKTTFENELNRVIIHGLLHLVGYNDKNEEQKKEMRFKEDSYLSLFKN